SFIQASTAVKALARLDGDRRYVEIWQTVYCAAIDGPAGSISGRQIGRHWQRERQRRAPARHYRVLPLKDVTSTGKASVMIPRHERGRNADEKRFDGIAVAALIDGDNRGCRFAFMKQENSAKLR